MFATLVSQILRQGRRTHCEERNTNHSNTQQKLRCLLYLFQSFLAGVLIFHESCYKPTARNAPAHVLRLGCYRVDSLPPRGLCCYGDHVGSPQISLSELKALCVSAPST